MHVMILGGDGFCGWPTALHLSDQGHDVTIVDNMSRRDIDNELSVESLTPIATMSTRLKAWHERAGEAAVEVAVTEKGAVTAGPLRLDATTYKREQHKNKFGKDYSSDEKY